MLFPIAKKKRVSPASSPLCPNMHTQRMDARREQIFSGPIWTRCLLSFWVFFPILTRVHIMCKKNAWVDNHGLVTTFNGQCMIAMAGQGFLDFVSGLVLLIIFTFLQCEHKVACCKSPLDALCLFHFFPLNLGSKAVSAEPVCPVRQHVFFFIVQCSS